MNTRISARTGWRACWQSSMLCVLCTCACGAQQPVTTNLDLWLRADAGVTHDISGNVSGWSDQSGNGHDGSQASSGNQPLFVSSAINGNPTLRFSGASQFLSLSGQVIQSQQFTIMAVVSDTHPANDFDFREIVSNWDLTNNNITSVFLGTTYTNNTDGVRFTDDMGGATDPNHNQTGVGALADPTSDFILSGISGTSDATVYQGGTLLASNGAALSARDLTTTYNIGTQGGFEFWQGDIAEILVYDSALTSSQFQTNLNYLQGKYFTAAVPEPGSLALLTGMSFAGAGLLRRATRRRGARIAS